VRGRDRTWCGCGGWGARRAHPSAAHGAGPACAHRLRRGGRAAHLLLHLRLLQIASFSAASMACSASVSASSRFLKSSDTWRRSKPQRQQPAPAERQLLAAAECAPWRHGQPSWRQSPDESRRRPGRSGAGRRRRRAQPRRHLPGGRACCPRTPRGAQHRRASWLLENQTVRSSSMPSTCVYKIYVPQNCRSIDHLSSDHVRQDVPRVPSLPHVVRVSRRTKRFFVLHKPDRALRAPCTYARTKLGTGQTPARRRGCTPWAAANCV
jgi:hypothetical protein